MMRIFFVVFWVAGVMLLGRCGDFRKEESVFSALKPGEKSLLLEGPFGGDQKMLFPLADIAAGDLGRVLYGDGVESLLPKKRVFIDAPAPRPRNASVRNHMSRVKAQGARASCPTFAAIALMESYGNGPYSEQCLARDSNPKQDSGFMRRKLEWAHDNYLYAEKDCPYDGKDRDRLPEDLEDARKQTAPGTFNFIDVEREKLIAEIKKQIDAGLPVGVATYYVGHQWTSYQFFPKAEDCKEFFSEKSDIEECRTINEDFSFLKNRKRLKELMKKAAITASSRERVEREDYRGYDPIDVPSPASLKESCRTDARSNTAEELRDGKKKCTSHAFVITGYDDEEEAFEIRNSWGDGWHAKGYSFMTYRYFARFHMLEEMNKPIVYDNRIAD